jgi:hypothetical protein
LRKCHFLFEDEPLDNLQFPYSKNIEFLGIFLFQKAPTGFMTFDHQAQASDQLGDVKTKKINKSKMYF